MIYTQCRKGEGEERRERGRKHTLYIICIERSESVYMYMYICNAHV